jgi:hypothetical protein
MQVLQRFIAMLGFSLLPVTAAIGVEGMSRVDTFGDWMLLADSKTPHLLCFVTSEPKASEPKGAQRDTPRAYISAWPKDGIKSEVSFRMGFKIKKNAEGTATVTPGGYRLFGANDRAYVSDSTQELKLVEAMRKGNTMTVAIASERGTLVTDTYSLSGLGMALQKLQETCF